VKLTHRVDSQAASPHETAGAPAAQPPDSEPADPAGAPAVRVGRSNWWWVLAVPILVVLLRGVSFQYVGAIGFRTAYLRAVTCLVLLLCLFIWMRRGPFWPRRMIENRRQLAAVALLLLVGAAWRLYRFDVYPPRDGQLWEETQMGAGGYSTLTQGGLDNFFPITTLITETGFRFLGVSMRTLRVPFVLCGIASVAIFFVAARLFFRTFFAAWLATGLFATSALLAAAARIALETMAPITTECVALAAVFYACTRRDAAAFALAGLANGLLLTEYFSYKIVPVFGALLLLVFFLRAGDTPYCNAALPRCRGRHLVRSLPLFALAAAFGLAMVLPVLLSEPDLMPFIEGFARHKAGLVAQESSMSIQEVLSAALSRAKLTATFVFVGGGGADLLPLSMGAIEFFTGVLGVGAGIYCAFRSWRSPAKLFLVVSAVLTVVLSGALVQNPQRYRLIPLVPIWFLMVAVPVDDVLTALPRHRRAVSVLAVAVLVAVAGINAYNLFVVAMNDPDVRLNFYDLNVPMALEIRARQQQDPHATVYLLSRREHLQYVNDYYFLYDHQRVKVVPSIDQLADKHGFLLADNEFVPVAESFPRAADCHSWRTALHSDQLISCRLLSEGESR